MDNSQTSSHPVLGAFWTVATFICGFLSAHGPLFVSIPPDAEVYMKLAATVATIIAAFFASRYHIIAAREKIVSIKKNKS